MALVQIEIGTGRKVDLHDHATIRIEDQVTGKALRALKTICRYNKTARIWEVKIQLGGQYVSSVGSMNVVALSSDDAVKEATARLRKSGSNYEVSSESPRLRYSKDFDFS